VAELIDDPEDPRLADYRALTDVELRTRFEEPHGLFIAEGELVLRRALAAGYQARSILVDAKRVAQVADLPTEAPIYAASLDLLQTLTGFHVHRGVLGSIRRKPLPFRGAAALGMDGVLLSPSCADPLYRRSVRVSMGEVFAVPYARLDPWEPGLQAVRSAGFTLLALTPAADALPIQDLSTVQRARPALLLGAEGAGLSPVALKAADARVVIPMRRGVDSLNVAAAAAVAFWELSRTD
jgi:tRNA G18 (ribose-2'-O)-methylase SpoU